MQITDVNTGVEVLVNAIKTDYRDWTLRGDEYSEVNTQMINEFDSGLEVKKGQKYFKIINNTGGVWGFVVKNDDDKFKAGDILRAASWNSPTRNKARGNVLDGFSVSWTGPKYLV
jgi:hypothetical protein